jgi:hypothetical protein
VKIFRTIQNKFSTIKKRQDRPVYSEKKIVQKMEYACEEMMLPFITQSSTEKSSVVLCVTN